MIVTIRCIGDKPGVLGSSCVIDYQPGAVPCPYCGNPMYVGIGGARLITDEEEPSRLARAELMPEGMTQHLCEQCEQAFYSKEAW